MDRSLELKDKNIGSLLLNFSIPAIIGMLVNSLYNIVDRIFLGQGVGRIAIAATTVAFPIMIVLMAVSMLIGIGATSLISIRLGEQKIEEAERIAGNATTMFIILPAICTIIFEMFPDQILTLFGSSPTVLPYAKEFLRIIMLGSVFGAISMGMNNFIRAEGNPTRAMSTQILGAVINIILNYLFVMRLGFGIKGSAMATVIAQFVSAMWVLSYFMGGNSLVKIRLKNMIPNFRVLMGIIAIGFAPFAMQLANSVQNVILNKTLHHYGGDLALSAVGIVMAIGTIMIMPLIGLNQGAQPIIGYNYGAKQYSRVKETLKIAILAATCFCVAGFLVIRLWAAEIVTLFTGTDVALTSLATHALKTFFLVLPIVGFQIVCAGYFQAVGKALQSAVLSLSRQVLFLIPLLLILPKFWGLEGAWRTPPIADVLSVLLTGTLIFYEMKKINKLMSVAPSPTKENEEVEQNLELSTSCPRP